MTDLSLYTLPNDTGVCLLDCSDAFEGLTDRERKYAHYIAQASWFGGLIVLVQTSPESPAIFVLLQKIFKSQPITELKRIAADKGLSDEDFQAILIYAAAVYSNMGNYKAFGDSKIIPKLPQEKFEAFVNASAEVSKERSAILNIWDKVKTRLYSLGNQQKELGLGDKGTTSYFSSNCDQRDAELAQDFMNSKLCVEVSCSPIYIFKPDGWGPGIMRQCIACKNQDISPYNTRLFKTADKATGKVEYEVRLASSEKQGGKVCGCCDDLLGVHSFTPKGASEPTTFRVTRGDYSPLMALVVENLNKAKDFASCDLEKKMVQHYMESFSQGSIPAHKDGSRCWIQNKGPIVETYIGFIESYRDPFGVRGEFEGFVAVVNKEMSAKFGALVENSEKLLALLPWPSAYEKDKFLRPDFTSLDVLAFAGSGIPAGINIPNYDDIRQEEGFKNVSLGNVLTAQYKESKITFLAEKDKELYSKLKIQAFEVQVGLHELLGHGSGKLFKEDENGKLNFDKDHIMHAVTEKEVTSWYKAGETWDSKFTSLASTYEECRAECVGLYLCLSTQALSIFGHEDEAADDIIYINWLNMARAGLLALEFFSPETRAWRQAHMNARFVILRVLLEAGEDLVKIEKVPGDDGKPDILLTMDRSKINTVGKPAIGDFLKKLQTYKSLGDVSEGKRLYEYYSDVHDCEEPHFISLREIVLDRKQPRKMFVQHNTQIQEDGSVSLKKYATTAAGLIESNIDRYKSSDAENILLQLWENEMPFFQW